MKMCMNACWAAGADQHDKWQKQQIAGAGRLLAVEVDDMSYVLTSSSNTV